MNLRGSTIKIKVGNVIIGGNKNNVVIQTMLTEKAENYNQCLRKIKKLYKIGCEIVRVAIFNQKDIEGLKILVKKSPIPIVADIQFNADYAIQAIRSGAAKIRINPGNLGKDKIVDVINECKINKIPIRIGINSGSLEPDLYLRYGFTSKALIKSIDRNIKLVEKHNFYNIIISVKSSDPQDTIKAYIHCAKKYKYPLHLGLTEAGSSVDAIVKSSCCLGKLLEMGIGDTIRISISDDPIIEIKAAKHLLKYYGVKKNVPNLIACPTCGRLTFKMLKLVKKISTFLDEINSNINIAVMGCSVNGPGEAKHADIALCGGSDSETANLYIDGKFKRSLINPEIFN